MFPTFVGRGPDISLTLGHRRTPLDVDKSQSLLYTESSNKKYRYGVFVQLRALRRSTADVCRQI